MDYAFKVTTNGRAVITACGGMEKPLRITRAAVGSGMVPDGVKLADVHELYQYVAEAAVSERRHENDHLYLTVQYTNTEHREQQDFILSEIIVYVEDPENGGETDLLYATLGDYRQPVPAYKPGIPGSVFSYPMVLVVSDEIEVQVFASPGIVTTDVLEKAMSAIKEELEETTKIEAEEPPTPETEGRPGQHYFDSKTGREYVCKGTDEEGKYIWEAAATTSDIEQKISKHNVAPEAHPAITARTRGLELALIGSETLTGEGAPTAETMGEKDQRYIDLTTGEEFACTAAEDGTYTWEPAEEAPSFMDKIAEAIKISEATKAALGLNASATLDQALFAAGNHIILDITFASPFVGEQYTITGAGLPVAVTGTVPSGKTIQVPALATKSEYTVACNGTTVKMSTAEYFGVYRYIFAAPLASCTAAVVGEVAATGMAPQVWSIGDEINITLTDDEIITMQIYDFNHDTLAAGGTAPITFGMKNLMATTHRIEATNINTNGWSGSEMYTYLNTEVYSKLPAEWRDIIKKTRKLTSAGNKSGVINTSDDSLFLFCEEEIVGDKINAVAGEGRQYPIFTDAPSQIKKLSNGAGGNWNWWLRSPHADSATYFCAVRSSGTTYYYGASDAHGVAFGFCV